MRIDRTGEEIARDLTAAASKTWGSERADALKNEIETHAKHLSLVGRYDLPLDGDEPDFLVAPYPEVEAD